MPTREEFETAAELFMDAAALIAELAGSVDGVDVTSILRGGSLGCQVPERLAQAAASAHRCEAEVVQAAETCRERAGIIANYELQLAVYDSLYRQFQSASLSYAADYAAWFLDETGTIGHPGEAPQPPREPEPPPEWAEGRWP